MKSILVFYKLLFFKPLYVVSNAFLFLIFVSSTLFQLFFPEHIVILRIFIFGSIFLLVFFNFSRYIWFISKYKKEALNLSNEKLKKKYPQLLRIEKNVPQVKRRSIFTYGIWLRSQMPLTASKFNEQDLDYEEKQKFLYKIYLRYYIVESFLVAILIASLTLFYYFMFTTIYSVAATRDNNLSVIPDIAYSVITGFIFFVIALTAAAWINQSQFQLLQISNNLLTVSVEESKKTYKSTFFKLYIPKEI
ncbi:hypothetical protein [Mesomycoplasma ovipneumoniae]|uniref:Uncharacterized protein n=1 Tax=Mesomycoplasma ovipneumoniae TaxID=29562 RepID=A0AAP6CTZ4_9BACT|nr:hypothetical protein [Mesomycoplasma ovipneumoniae]MDW2906870.1 hypothetical protein [Mesomycoplasma ovipneumoniae]MDW2910889.1 hypothetical protein [Mesomycoplasma ovipneumoniae]MDW2912452.1 hypothetical protein [Mesomycoplasma ovipneumoniae]MDW2912609.1 hypothetical protein [Mesomycoplasma ovipneumoniae]MDW2916117.1 hypothetical protein [Mesomycoplasma ovipneumoniae]